MDKADYSNSKMSTMLEDIKHDILYLIKKKLKKFESLKIEELCEKLCISTDLYDKRFRNPESPSWRNTPIEQLLEWCYRLDIPLEFSLSVGHGLPHSENIDVSPLDDSEELILTEYTNMEGETNEYPYINYDQYKYSYLANIESFIGDNEIIYSNSETYDKSSYNRYIDKSK